ncbi:MAG: P27 family phage terminase small subunit [Vicinamibacterales bacterium]
MSEPKAPAPPRHLKPATRRWWSEVVRRWELEPHHVRLLTLCAEAWDRCQQARQLVDREGLTTTTGAGGAKLHPAVRVEADARLAFARLLRELDLDVEPPSAEARRPPELRSIAGGRR